jgi:hypothetical protein
MVSVRRIVLHTPSANVDARDTARAVTKLIDVHPTPSRMWVENAVGIVVKSILANAHS